MNDDLPRDRRDDICILEEIIEIIKYQDFLRISYDVKSSRDFPLLKIFYIYLKSKEHIFFFNYDDYDIAVSKIEFKLFYITVRKSSNLAILLFYGTFL